MSDREDSANGNMNEINRRRLGRLEVAQRPIGAFILTQERTTKTFTPFLIVAAAMAVPGVVSAAERDLSCRLKFTSRECCALYDSAVGEGTVTCKDGSSIPVAINAKGVGVTAGKWKITDGKGKFTHAAKIDDVLGSCLAVGGDVGMAKAGTAKILAKGKVSLALAGKGEGFDIGIAISDFKIGKPAVRAK